MRLSVHCLSPELQQPAQGNIVDWRHDVWRLTAAWAAWKRLIVVRTVEAATPTRRAISRLGTPPFVHASNAGRQSRRERASDAPPSWPLCLPLGCNGCGSRNMHGSRSALPRSLERRLGWIRDAPALAIYLHFTSDRTIGCKIFVTGKRETRSAIGSTVRSALPIEAFGCGRDHVAGASIIQVAQSIVYRISAAGPGVLAARVQATHHRLCRIIGTIVSVAARSPRRGCSARARSASAAFPQRRRDQDRRLGYGTRLSAHRSQTAQPRTMARSQRAPGRAAYRFALAVFAAVAAAGFPRPAPGCLVPASG